MGDEDETAQRTCNVQAALEKRAWIVFCEFLWQLDAAVLLLVLAALILPYRTFFPSEQLAG